MKNILVVGGTQESRFKYALEKVTSSICLADSKPCNKCSNCTRVLNNNHPNVFFIKPLINEQGTQESIKIEQIRHILLEQQKQAFENTLSFFVISDFNNITNQAANALLKSLEETHPQKVFICLAFSKMSVLATLRSRLVIKSLKPLIDKDDIDESIKSTIDTLCNTSLNKRYSLINRFPQEKPETIKYLLQMQKIIHLFLSIDKERTLPDMIILKISEGLEKSIESLEKNINVRLVTENLILKLWPYYPKTIR